MIQPVWSDLQDLLDEDWCTWRVLLELRSCRPEQTGCKQTRIRFPIFVISLFALLGPANGSPLPFPIDDIIQRDDANVKSRLRVRVRVRAQAERPLALAIGAMPILFATLAPRASCQIIRQQRADLHSLHRLQRRPHLALALAVHLGQFLVHLILLASPPRRQGTRG